MALPGTAIDTEFRIYEFCLSSLIFSFERTTMKAKLQILERGGIR